MSSIPRCFECGNRLVYTKNGLAFRAWVDPIGNTHKMHINCFNWGGYATPELTAKADTLKETQHALQKWA